MDEKVRRTVKVVGTGEHHLTKILDADTGEDIGIRYGVSRIEYRIGDKEAYPEPRLVLELLCPVIIEINPHSRERENARRHRVSS